MGVAVASCSTCLCSASDVGFVKKGSCMICLQTKISGNVRALTGLEWWQVEKLLYFVQSYPFSQSAHI